MSELELEVRQKSNAEAEHKALAIASQQRVAEMEHEVTLCLGQVHVLHRQVSQSAEDMGKCMSWLGKLQGDDVTQKKHLKQLDGDRVTMRRLARPLSLFLPCLSACPPQLLSASTCLSVVSTNTPHLVCPLRQKELLRKCQSDLRERELVKMKDDTARILESQLTEERAEHKVAVAAMKARHEDERSHIDSDTSHTCCPREV